MSTVLFNRKNYYLIAGGFNVFLKSLEDRAASVSLAVFSKPPLCPRCWSGNLSFLVPFWFFPPFHNFPLFVG